MGLSEMDYVRKYDNTDNLLVNIFGIVVFSDNIQFRFSKILYSAQYLEKFVASKQNCLF